MIQCYSEREMLEFGQAFAKKIKPGDKIYLYGNLGSGKTTLVKGILSGLGYDGAVKSPTYTLVENYDFNDFAVYHFDLYRLADPEELEWLGIRDYFNEKSICLIEWPEKGQGFLPLADIILELDYLKPQGRVIREIFSNS